MLLRKDIVKKVVGELKIKLELSIYILLYVMYINQKRIIPIAVFVGTLYKLKYGVNNKLYKILYSYINYFFK